MAKSSPQGRREERSFRESPHPRMLGKGTPLHTLRLVSVHTHALVSLPESKRNATWIFPFGRGGGSLAERKEAGPGARIPGPEFQLMEPWRVAPVLWTLPSCPHCAGAKISSHSVFTTLDGPKASVGLANSSKTHGGPPGGFHFPRISLSACVSWNASLLALSLPCPGASLHLVM